MVVCMNKAFARLLRKADIDNDKIDLAINKIIQGNCIPLGHKLFKKRVASRYQGKSGAYRSIVYYRTAELMVFLYLFAKNDRENITPKEMKELIQISRLYDSMNEKAVENAINEERLARWNYETH